MKIVILAGGVGGARMARGFSALSEVQTTVVVNVADDDRLYGLEISPDIDTVVYTLASAEGQFGWGREHDTWEVMGELARFGIDTSFRLGDKDLALNLYRTEQLANGVPLSQITRDQCLAFDLAAEVLPVSDSRIRTHVQLASSGAWIDFQTYFVRRQHQDLIMSVRYQGIEDSLPAPGVLEAVEQADAVVVAPSNPLLSIIPILDVPGIRQAISAKPVVAISPLIDGKTVKGPAAEVMSALGHNPTGKGVLEVYGDEVDHFGVANGDGFGHPDVAVHETVTMADTWERGARLAREIMSWLR